MTSPVPHNPNLGVRLQDTYQLTRVIGEGGMGTVYEAIHLRLRKRMAIKVMAMELTQDPESLARFKREASITSTLGHPHIVHVADFGTSERGQPYLVMELLEGEDLEHRLQFVPQIGIAETIGVVRQVASALAVAHEKGVVHRDLKPANIYLVTVPGDADFVKVLDFGISKARSAITKLTNNNTVLGTPFYMSPEQAAGRSSDLDHRTDQWALACVTWQMLAGQCPFQGEDSNQILYQVTFGSPPPLASLVPGLPSEVEQVLRRALSKKHTGRYDSILQFSDALEQAAFGIVQRDTTLDSFAGQTHTLPPVSPPSPTRSRLGRIALVAASLVALGTGLILLSRPPNQAVITSAPSRETSLANPVKPDANPAIPLVENLPSAPVSPPPPRAKATPAVRKHDQPAPFSPGPRKRPLILEL